MTYHLTIDHSDIISANNSFENSVRRVARDILCYIKTNIYPEYDQQELLIDYETFKEYLTSKDRIFTMALWGDSGHTSFVRGTEYYEPEKLIISGSESMNEWKITYYGKED